MIVLMTKRGNTGVVKVRPFVKWVGGKGRLVPQLLEHFPEEYNDYYEPFVGGGALFFAIAPPVAHISDMNNVLISAYKRIKSDVEGLILELQKLQDEYRALPTLEDNKEYYLAKRAEFNSLDNSAPEKVALLIFLNKTCFNGMYRENRNGGFNVPFGKNPKATICDADNLRAVAKELKHTSIKLSSYEKAIENAKAGDFVYLDPPYHPLNATSSFTSYHADGFTADDQIKLRDTFKELSERGCKVMLSNSNSDFINDIYKEFNIHKIHAARSINANGAGRGKIQEVLVTNY